MKFLAKAGKLIAQATSIVLGFGPIVWPGHDGTINTIASELAQLGQVILDVEAIGNALEIKGPDKLKAAAPLVSQVILRSSIMAHRKIDDVALFQKACAEIGSGMADLLNSLKDDVDTQNKT